jgi:glycosyltransferase involved in cell wall biosynthesis
MNYILITAARNEVRFIEKTLSSVAAQTVLPERWFIVDDGSTDQTAEIIENFARRFAWIELIRQPQRAERSFAGKVNAFHTALQRAESLQFEVVGNIDADISFEPDHLAFLLQKFSEDPRLGVAGTPFTEEGYDSAQDSFEGERHVAGQCQLFRLQCFREIGGYVPNPAGGVDWMAVTTARMKGWKTQSFLQKRFHHYRPMGTAETSGIGALFSYGQKDYYLGGSPVWQLFRVCYRSTKRPFLVGGLALLGGYCWAGLRRVQRPVSPELMRFHRREQMTKLRFILRSLLSRRRIDNFRLASDR